MRVTTEARWDLLVTIVPCQGGISRCLTAAGPHGLLIAPPTLILTTASVRTKTIATVTLFAATTFLAAAQNQSQTEWPVYGGQPSQNHYSSLAQINRTNVKDLQVAWRDLGQAVSHGFTRRQQKHPRNRRLLWVIRCRFRSYPVAIREKQPNRDPSPGHFGYP